MLDQRQQHKPLSHSLLSLLRTLTQTGAAHNKIRGNSVTPFTHQGTNVRRCSLRDVFVRHALCTWVGWLGGLQQQQKAQYGVRLELLGPETRSPGHARGLPLTFGYAVLASED